MNKRLVLAIVMVFGTLSAAEAQQANAPQSRGLGAGTPGVATGTTGTTYSTPGADQQQTVPGGGIPMGAATQDTSNLPSDPNNVNNSGSRKSR